MNFSDWIWKVFIGSKMYKVFSFFFSNQSDKCNYNKNSLRLIAIEKIFLYKCRIEIWRRSNLLTYTQDLAYTENSYSISLISNWIAYDRGDSFPFEFEPNEVPFGWKSKGKLSPRSYPIRFVRKWKHSFLSMGWSNSRIIKHQPARYVHRNWKKFVSGFFAAGQFAVKKNVSFG